MPVTVRCALAKNAPLSSFPRRRKPSSRKLDPPPAGGDSKGGSFITFGGPQAHGVLGVTVQSHFFHSLFCPVCLSRTAGLQPGRCRPKGRRCLARRRGSWRRGNPSMTDRLSPRRLGQAASSRPACRGERRSPWGECHSPLHALEPPGYVAVPRCDLRLLLRADYGQCS